MKRRPEEQIHRAVVSHLNLRPERGVFFFHAANGGFRTKAEAGIFKALGVKAGIPDILILKSGSLYALELKAAKGSLTPSQRLVIARMEECGAQVAVAHSIDEALVTLEFWGILKRPVNHRVSEAEGTQEVA